MVSSTDRRAMWLLILFRSPKTLPFESSASPDLFIRLEISSRLAVSSSYTAALFRRGARDLPQVEMVAMRTANDSSSHVGISAAVHRRPLSWSRPGQSLPLQPLICVSCLVLCNSLKTQDTMALSKIERGGAYDWGEAHTQYSLYDRCF